VRPDEGVVAASSVEGDRDRAVVERGKVDLVGAGATGVAIADQLRDVVNPRLQR
jgi:NADH dehydrogenase FAD-containing subunit